MEMVMSQQVRRIAELEASEGKLQHGKRKVGEESPGNISAHAAIWKPTSRRHRPQMLSGINGPSSRPSTTTRNLNLCLELKLQRREMSLTCSCSAAPASAEQPKDAGKAQIQVLNIECYLQSCEGSLDIHPVWADVSDLQASDLRHFSPRWVRLRGLQANKVEKKSITLRDRLEMVLDFGSFQLTQAKLLEAVRENRPEMSVDERVEMVKEGCIAV